MRRLLRPLWILLALVFLFEAWLWEHLRPIVAWIVDRIRWDTLKTQVAQWIDRLPPAATFLVFLVPVLLLLPLKIVGLWMLAHGSWLGAMATLALAKVVSMGVTAFIFDLTRPKLLQLAWFRWLYDHVIVWLEKAHALVDPLKAELRAWLKAIRRRVRVMMWLLRPNRAGRFMRRALWLRRRAQQRAQAA
ncbi:MAG TPA: hypothetical protein VKE26_02265 [Xanthobacteraceae bacterium]|nr:hypothetical protein [Xanthobacteraceae bacterium]